MRTTRAAIVVSVIVLALQACANQVHMVKPTPDLIKRVGLPLYPGAKILYAEESAQSVLAIRMRSASVSLQTSDGFEKAEQFYAARVPKNTRRTELPLGPMHSVTFVYFSGPDQKQITVMAYHDMTDISLRATAFGGRTERTPSPR